MTQSHLHYDHVGNHDKFVDIVFPDLEHLRLLESKGTMSLSASQHLGFVENTETPKIRVTKWLGPDAEIDLGNRTIKMIHAPGHTPDSIVLLDPVNQMLFTGDLIYYGPLFAMLPGCRN
ncbi:MAG: hydroxyacylglutathione hydrolase [Candidatus Azotimanducaceae bacterium]